MGNAHFELGGEEVAIKCFTKDPDIVKALMGRLVVLQAIVVLALPCHKLQVTNIFSTNMGSLERYKYKWKWKWSFDLSVLCFRDLKEARSRALENMGRVHARVGEFDTAICLYVVLQIFHHCHLFWNSAAYFDDILYPIQSNFSYSTYSHSLLNHFPDSCGKKPECPEETHTEELA